jgi:hypothetical protein
VRQEKKDSDKSFLVLLHDSCNAFYRYENLRHLSDIELRRRGLARDQVARALFEELYGR